MENLSTLTGKYGEEGDRLLFKILNNGDFLAKADKEALSNGDSAALTYSIADRGLRYDLTVPFARYVVMHQNDISFPFKRYQIQQVWRADRPQRGRYREFYQCDVDVVGSDSLMYEAELVKIYDEVFSRLGLKVNIKINNRKILFGIAEAAGVADKFLAMTVAIDKLDKIGESGVRQELESQDFDDNAITSILKAIAFSSLDQLSDHFYNSPVGKHGVGELRSFHQYVDQLKLNNVLELDVSLARGLNYYTGCIVEVMAKDVQMGSIGGGGRYDDLTGVFGMPGVSGVGISLGAERIYDCLEELQLFPTHLDEDLKLLIIAMDDESHLYAFKCLAHLRDCGIVSDLYPSPSKMKKQMKYANDRNVPFILIIGAEEIQSGLLSLKDMHTGIQQQLPIEAVANKIKGH
jgi:histidyl-tRNA synthetase